MSALLINLLKQNSTYLVLSGFIFPLSLKVSLVCFTIFIFTRVLLSGDRKWSERETKFNYLIKIAFGITFGIAIVDFYYESRIHFYPVSYYDYLLVAVVALVIKLYPLKPFEIERFCLAFSLSPIIVFLNYFTTVDFQMRNNWGFDNSNALGLYCTICLPFILCQLLIRTQKLLIYNKQSILNRRILLFFCNISFLLCSIFIVSSGSRSALYTSLVLTLVILLIYLRETEDLFLKSKDSLAIDKNIILYISSCLGLTAILYQFILTKFVFLRRFIDLTNSTNVYRTYVYRCYWNLGLEKPWWGWGIDKTSALCEAELNARYGGVNHAHNFMLQIFADSGAIVTLLCSIAIAHLVVIPIVRFIVNFKFEFLSVLYLGIYISCLSILIVSLFQSSFYHYPLFPIWLGLFTSSIDHRKLKSNQ